ncbi:uncharacterized protein LOC116131495 [Pistacia vera]|uniref:uncharacterized protein LOC116131495 n=1 Tax=Pistacia vera TaxID=55513 RepID=UPI0012639764|nr:uncharacterized protein LOC116131495 [Pistacia vera]
MKKKYQGMARVKSAQLQALCKEFELLHMKVGELVNDYFARTLTVANKMRIHGEQMGDVVIIEMILRSMTPKYDYVSNLLVHEQRIMGHVMEEQGLKVNRENHSLGEVEAEEDIENVEEEKEELTWLLLSATIVMSWAFCL